MNSTNIRTAPTLCFALLLVLGLVASAPAGAQDCDWCVINCQGVDWITEQCEELGPDCTLVQCYPLWSPSSSEANETSVVAMSRFGFDTASGCTVLEPVEEGK